jgi:hypothetical protein
VERSVRSWKFELIPAGPVDFDLAYEFALSDKASDHADEETTFDIPGRVRLVSNPLIHPNYAQTTGRRGE